MFKRNNVHALVAQHLQAVEECLINYESFIRAASSGESNRETLRALASGVAASEDKADKALRSIIDSLGSGYLATTREEIISLVTACDKVANKCESTAKAVVIQHVQFPKEFSAHMIQILEVIRQQFHVLEQVVGTFFEKFTALLNDHSVLDEIRTLETQVDRIEDKLKENLFDMDISLAEKLQLEQFLEWLADPSDIIENIADHIQIMLISRKV